MGFGKNLHLNQLLGEIVPLSAGGFYSVLICDIYQDEPAREQGEESWLIKTTL